MKRFLGAFGAAVALALAGFLLLTRPGPPPDYSPRAEGPDLANGELVFHAAGCGSCHGEDLGGGLEMKTAFGTFRAPNISPHPEHGIGGWTDSDFLRAMMRGVSPQGRHYYPAFPYTSYARGNARDWLDLKAWLDSRQPNSRIVDSHELTFPWSIRRGIGLWKRRYLDPNPVSYAAAGGDSLTRGRYLVEALGHCAECHTPRNRFGGLDKDRWLAGGPNPDGEGRVPNITPHPDGIAEWSERDIFFYLQTGFTPDFDTVGGSMVDVQENLARLDETDLAAIASYLKSLEPIARLSE